MTTTATVTETVYLLTGATLGPFATVWPYETAANVAAWLDIGGGPLALAQTGDFTVAGGTPLTNGGMVTLQASTLNGAAAWPAGTRLILGRQTSEDQPSALGEVTGFSPSTYEAALDHLDRQIQDADQAQAKAVRGGPGDNLPPLPDAVARAGLYLAFDTNGNPVVQAADPTTGAAIHNVGPITLTGLTQSQAYISDDTAQVNYTVEAWSPDREAFVLQNGVGVVTFVFDATVIALNFVYAGHTGTGAQFGWVWLYCTGYIAGICQITVAGVTA